MGVISVFKRGNGGGKMIFFKIDVEFCIDISFMNRIDEEYYKGVLLFVVLNIGMVIYFFFDYMYFVCLGVIKCFFFC